MTSVAADMAKRKMSTFERIQKGCRLNRQQRRELQQRLYSADPGLQIVHPDAAGIDVGSKSRFKRELHKKTSSKNQRINGFREVSAELWHRLTSLFMGRGNFGEWRCTM